MKNFFFDLETTGTNPYRHGIHQISAIIEIDGKEIDKVNLKVKPNKHCEIDEEALAVSGITLADIAKYMEFVEGYKQLNIVLGNYCDKFDKLDKFHLIGYNNAGFDNQFLRQFYEQNGDKYFNSWFWIDTIDVMVLASQALRKVREKIPNFKLPTVAKGLGINVDAEKLHDAFYDITLTKELYYKLCKN